MHSTFDNQDTIRQNVMSTRFRALLGRVTNFHATVHFYGEYRALWLRGSEWRLMGRSMELPALGLDFWSWLDNGSCHRRLFPFADHDGVHFLREGVIVITLCSIYVCCSFLSVASSSCE